MERNWYAVYTKPNKEKKVITALTKKGIKNYCPLNNITNLHKGITEYRPLFKSYVFVYITEAEMIEVKNTPYISNFVFYKSKPAVIQRKEITLVKKMTTTHTNIISEKIQIGIDETAEVSNVPFLGYESDIMTLNAQAIRVTLPSLGYSLLSGMEQHVNTTQHVQKGASAFRKLIPGNLKSLLAN